MAEDPDVSFLYDEDKSDETFRRQLRKELRENNQDLLKNREDITIPEKLTEKLDNMNTLFSDVVAPKEAALDAEGFLLLSSIGREQVESIQGKQLDFDYVQFAEKLVTLMSGRRGDDTLDWTVLGGNILSAGVFKKPPALSFLHGALDLEPLKKRQQSQRAQRRVASRVEEATKPKEVVNFGGEEESTTKDVAHIYKHVRKACEARGRLHYFKFLVDPDSFAHSVENMFHFSFLIKDGRAGIIIGKDKQPYIYLPSEVNESGQSTKTVKKQFIVSLRICDWERAKEKFKITRAAIPPRQQ